MVSSRNPVLFSRLHQHWEHCPRQGPAHPKTHNLGSLRQSHFIGQHLRALSYPAPHQAQCLHTETHPFCTWGT